MADTDYQNLPALRAALTEDDPDKRADAYSSVLNADVQPSQVLEPDPEESVVNTLVQAGVVPEQSSEDRTPASEQRARMVSLLEDIKANTGGSA